MKKMLVILLALMLCLGPVSAVRADETSDFGIQKYGKTVRSSDEVDLYDVVTFGRYPQSERGASAAIEWIVVGINGDRLKLLSRYALDSKQYHTANEDVSWQDSYLFTWLNNQFMNAAFTDQEQQFLSSPISLPTLDEAKQLPSFIRIAESTAYAVSQGADPNLCYWWLSSYNGPQQVSGGNKQWTAYCASAVLENGRILDPGFQVNYGGKTVRPIIEVDLKKGYAAASDTSAQTKPSSQASISLDGVKLTSAADLNLYDVVTFGSYPQTAYGQVADIEWIVIGIDGGRIRLLSRYALDSKQYNEENTATSWQNSTLYDWLNRRFMFSAFSDDEQMLLSSAVSLLTKEEAARLPDAIRICTSTPYAVAQGADARCFWWLSSYTGAYDINDHGKQWTAYCACAVLDNGEVADPGFQVSYTGKTVRPTVTVDLGSSPAPAPVDPPSDEPLQTGLRKDGWELASVSEIRLYDVLTLGNYPQTAYGTYAPIEWIVIGVNGNRVTLLSRYALDSQPFHKENAGVNWQWCSLNDWLNGSFRNTAFADEERQLLAAPVTLPTKEEAARLSTDIRICTSTAYAVAQGADARCIWWTSTYSGPWQVNSGGTQRTAHCACVVMDTGSVGDPGFQVNYTGKTVRPLITITF